MCREREDTGLRCFGEPDRRIIEGMRAGSSFVIRRAGPVGGSPLPVRHGAGPSETFLVDPSELLSPTEALDVFDCFRKTEELPGGYVAEPKSYLFG